MRDKLEEYACDFKNEAECEEEFNEDSLNIDDAEALHFEEE